MNICRDDFEHWLFEMDDELEALRDSMPDSVQVRMDYSLDSLGILEEYLLDKYRKIGEIRDDSEKRNLFRFSRYVGETIRLLAGGQ